MSKKARIWAVLIFTGLVFGLLKTGFGAEPAAIVSGTVHDSQNGEPLPGVTVMVQGTKIGTYSDLDGRFKLKNLSPGTYTLIFSLIGYQPSKYPDLKVSSGETEILPDILLTPQAIEVGGVEVTAKRVTHTEASLLQIQMKAASISDGISAEQIKKSPDADAAGALKRMTGVTVVGGKYIFVRGMGERYSNTLLNGSPLPSPEPKKRVIPMDLIPANLLENIVTTKTFTPDQWGNFAGGSVRLSTKEFPEKFTLRLGVSQGWDGETTSKVLYLSSGGKTDWLGIDDGSRNIPSLIAHAASNGWDGQSQWTDKTTDQVYSKAQLARSFRSIWDGRQKKALLNQGYSLSLGNQTELFNKPLGYIFSLTYSNKYDYREEKQTVYNAGMGLRSDWKIERSNYSVLWGGIFNLNYMLHPYHKILLNTTYTRDADGEVMWLDGYYEDWLWLESQTKWTEQSLAHFRLAGEHELPWFLSSNFEWSASYGKAEREEPDRATLLWANSTPEDTFYQLFDQKSGGNRFWELTQDDNFSFSWDWTKDFKQWSGLPAKLKIGWAQENTDRENVMWFYDVTNLTEKTYYGKGEIIQSRPFDNILDSAAAVKLSDKQSYWADKTITAGYLQIDMPLYQHLRMIAGTRVEKTDNEIRLYPTGSGIHPDPSRLRRVNKRHTDWLPSMNLTYSLMDRMNLRLAFSKTLTRPEYFELIEREDRELFENLKSYGNPQLEHTLISNYDLRWEFYSRPGELFAISYFHKNLRRPIEYIYIQKGTQTLKPINTKEARNSGLELEIRKQLDFIWSRLSNLSINANYAIISSKIRIDQTGSSGFVLTNSQRPLTGQSPYVVNLALGYENKVGTNFRLLYNRFGKRIAYPGTNGDPDIKERPFSQLDFTLEQRLYKGVGCKLNATNLLNSEVKFNQGDKPWRSYKKGTSFSLGLSYSI